MRSRVTAKVSARSKAPKKKEKKSDFRNSRSRRSGLESVKFRPSSVDLSNTEKMRARAVGSGARVTTGRAAHVTPFVRMGSKGDKSKTKYGAEGADGDAPDVETAAFTTKGSVTPNAAVEAKNSGSTGQNPWTSPTAVIFLLAFALAGYVCWIYSDQPAVGPAPKPEPTFTPSPEAPAPVTPPPEGPAVVTGNIMADMASGATNVPFNSPREDPDFDVHDVTNPEDPYAPAAPAEAVNGYDASGEDTPLPGEPAYVEAQEAEVSFEAGMGGQREKVPDDFVLAALGAAQERAY